MDEQPIVIAADSFKGSASSEEISVWLEQGIRRVVPNGLIDKFTVADGGEGTVNALVSALKGEVKSKIVQDPLGNPVKAHYGVLPHNIVVLEMAEASGITLIEQNSENALNASTYGVGELILAAIDEGAKEIYIGIGGSATSDGGTGMAKALGVSFLDSQDNPIPNGLKGLDKLAKIDTTKIDPRIAGVKINMLSDVTNPLIGEHGAIAVYGPQKGIPQELIHKLDRSMVHYTKVIQESLGIAIENVPGAGAAGGLGAALKVFCQAETYKGIKKILELIAIEDKIAQASLVITGEGKLDAQSINGKVPVGIAKLAKKYQKPVIAVVGSRDRDISKVYEAGIDLVLPIVNRPVSLAEAMDQVQENVVIAGETAIRAYLLNNRKWEI
ncbi:glycerate kinase [Marinilactibacillus kalidii]|uniref:glycerate kinase n=1 Tax=Marinilactibacillus kalidii TaxID=2820274 RepID=UPI001ABE976D|nr:glycerate kinase [Marinilactibacillus kalidii]